MNLNQIAGDAEHIRLYFYPGTRAARVLWMLEELALPHELVTLDLMQGEHHCDTYRAIHPLGKVPALEIEGKVIFESIGICLYLADKFSSKGFAPTFESQERATYYQWMAFANGTLEPVIIEQKRQQKAEKSNMNLVDMGPMLTDFHDVMNYINQTLSTRKFLINDFFSAADLLISALLIWAEKLGVLSGYAHIEQWLDSIKQRPAYQQVFTQ